VGLLEKMETPKKGEHCARTRAETDEAVDAWIMRKELIACGIRKEELAGLPKGDPDKVKIARRLRAETSSALKRIAALVLIWRHRLCFSSFV